MSEYLRIAFNNLRHAEKRTYLTIIGIFIGIAAVVALISVGQGLENSITEQFEQIGTDKLFITQNQDFQGTAGGDVTTPLTESDVEAIRGVRGVEEVTAWTLRSARVEVDEDLGFYFVAGIPLGEQYDLIRELTTIDLSAGRELRPGDRGSVLVGDAYTRPEEYLEPIRVGERIVVNGVKYSVAGILEPVGNSVDDHLIWMPQDEFEELFDIDNEVSQIVVQVTDADEIALTARSVERALLNERGLDEDEKDFEIQTPEELLASFNTILLIVRVVLIGIAMISLFVGGIGIMNTMYTAVLERTKEIGIMKAIGASPRDIRMIFLVEAGILGLVGGVIGVAVGLGIAKGVELIGAAALRTDFLSAYFGWELILGALVFSVLVGMASGYLPALQASRQNVVDSLRYE